MEKRPQINWKDYWDAQAVVSVGGIICGIVSFFVSSPFSENLGEVFRWSLVFNLGWTLRDSRARKEAKKEKELFEGNING